MAHGKMPRAPSRRRRHGRRQAAPDPRAAQPVAMPSSQLQRAAAIKLLQAALEFAKRSEEDPVIVAGVERNISLGGKVWALAWHARVEASKRLGDKRCSLRHEKTIEAAIALLERGWEPKA